MASEEFTTLLNQLNSDDNAARSQAESQYASLDATQKLQLLIPAAGNATLPDAVRALAAVLLRRTFTGQWDESWMVLNRELQGQLKSSLIQLLSGVSNDQVSSLVRKRVSDCVAELTRRLVDDAEGEKEHPWGEIVTVLIQMAQLNTNVALENVLNFIYQCPQVFGQMIDQYAEVIQQLFQSTLDASRQLEIRGLTVKCLANIIGFYVSNDQLIRRLQSLLPGIIATTADYSRQEDSTCLQAVVELQESVPKFSKPAAPQILEMSLMLSASEDVDEDVRAMGVELCVTIGESLPGAVRKKVPKAIADLCLVCLKMMAEIDEDAEWGGKTVPEDDDEDLPQLTVVGESSLDRIARSLGGQTVLKAIAPKIAELLNPASSWQDKRAALLALSAIAEGTAKSIKSILPELVPAMLPFLQDPHPRVRHAACNCVGQLSTDLAPEMQKMFHSQILQSLVPVLDDPVCRVRTHAGAALVNFIDDAPKEVIMPYLSPLCEKLAVVLEQHFQQTGPFMVLEQLCTTVAAVADKVEADFASEYHRFLPNLRSLLQATENAKAPDLPDQPDLRLLRGKTIECVSLIGLAVGKEKFLPDAHDIMQQLVKTQQDTSSWSDDDPQISYMISAWARICQILGDEFHQYLPMVMGPLMKAASFKPEVQLVDPDDVDEENGNEDGAWEYVNIGGGQSFGIATAGLEEKATACQMLVCYAKELGAKFEQYIEEVAKLMVPLLKFYFHDNVRCSAAQCIAPLIKCTLEAKGEAAAIELWKFSIKEVYQALETEPELEIIGYLFGAVASVADVIGREFLVNEESAEKLFAIMEEKMKEHLKRSDERITARTDEDYDEEIEEDLQNDDEEESFVLQKISDVVHNALGHSGSRLLPLFDQFLKATCAELIMPKRAWSDRQWGICLWDDIIEYGGEASWKYKDEYLPALARGIQDHQPEVRQASAYGVGILAKSGPAEASGSLKEYLTVLAQIIEGPMGRGDSNPEQIESTENAISAVAKIMRHRPDVAPTSQWLERWLSWLPVSDDREESANCYSFIADILNGQGFENLHEKMLYLVAHALTSDALEDDSQTAEKVMNICLNAKRANPAAWQQITLSINGQLPDILKS